MKRPIRMNRCPAELEKHFVLKSNRIDAYPKDKAAVRHYLEHMGHKS